jgi:hypothetical protein
MNVRSFLGTMVSTPAARVLRKDIREIVEQALSTRSFVMASELRAAEERIASLEKKLNMAMGAVQASSATLTQVRGSAEEALTAAKQALQLATTARATAESAVEGIGSIEDRLEGSHEAPAVDDKCRVPGCTERHRAKGFCARHYQQWRRSSLDNFVGPDGSAVIPGVGTVEVDRTHAGAYATREGGVLLLDGKPVG